MYAGVMTQTMSHDSYTVLYTVSALRCEESHASQCTVRSTVYES